MVKAIRGSELNDFLRCRSKWNWAWNEKLKAKTPNDKLFFGTLFHKFLEVYYNGNFDYWEARNAMRTMFDDTDTSGMEQFVIDELWELACEVTTNYSIEYKSDSAEYEVIATELQFDLPLNDNTRYTGTIDLVVKDKNGRVWFFDHKTTSSIEMYEKKADMDRQISRYWWALQQLGYEVEGFIYNIVLKDYPSKPAKLKNGSLSQNKAQKTTYELYLEAIQENEFDPNDYREILEHLKAQGNKFFRRVKVQRLQSEIDNAMQEMEIVAEDMDNARIYRNITKDCSWDCAFQSICVTSMNGSNVDYLKDQLFTKENTHD